MKAPIFKYHDPTTLAEALDLLARYGEDAKVLAGGQSLMPVLNFRLAQPEHLVDINRIAELGAIAPQDGHLSLGAMARQRTLERSADVVEACPAIAQAMPYVGHPQIRNRGTIGGSLAHADPAAELPAVMMAADAQLVLQSTRGQRVVAAEDFFIGQLTTALSADEMLVRIDLPACPQQTGSSVREIAMRAGDFALAGVVTCLTLATDGSVSRARIVCFGVGDRPIRLLDAETSLAGRVPTDPALEDAARLARERVDSFDDIHASAAYRKRVAGVLTRRALAESLTRIRQVVA